MVTGGSKTAITLSDLFVQALIRRPPANESNLLHTNEENYENQYDRHKKTTLSWLLFNGYW